MITVMRTPQSEIRKVYQMMMTNSIRTTAIERNRLYECIKDSIQIGYMKITELFQNILISTIILSQFVILKQLLLSEPVVESLDKL